MYMQMLYTCTYTCTCIYMYIHVPEFVASLLSCLDVFCGWSTSHVKLDIVGLNHVQGNSAFSFLNASSSFTCSFEFLRLQYIYMYMHVKMQFMYIVCLFSPAKSDASQESSPCRHQCPCSEVQYTDWTQPRPHRRLCGVQQSHMHCHPLPPFPAL